MDLFAHTDVAQQSDGELTAKVLAEVAQTGKDSEVAVVIAPLKLLNGETVTTSPGASQPTCTE